MAKTKFKCVVCGKLTAGRAPRGGDGTLRYPRKHKDKGGQPCPGNWLEAKWVNLSERRPPAERDVIDKGAAL